VGVVFTVLRTQGPTPTQAYYVHEVAYLEHRDPAQVGSVVKLEEALSKPFDKVLKRVA
jgi:hypothetical protein